MEEFKKIITLPTQDDKGINFLWDGGEAISVSVERNNNNEVLIKANKAGLVTLARHLLTLAEDSIEDRSHLHLDPETGVNAESAPLILEKDINLI